MRSFLLVALAFVLAYSNAFDLDSLKTYELDTYLCDENHEAVAPTPLLPGDSIRVCIWMPWKQKASNKDVLEMVYNLKLAQPATEVVSLSMKEGNVMNPFTSIDCTDSSGELCVAQLTLIAPFFRELVMLELSGECLIVNDFEVVGVGRVGLDVDLVPEKEDEDDLQLEEEEKDSELLASGAASMVLYSSAALLLGMLL